MRWEVRTMRSGTSFFNLPVFKKTVARYWPLWGTYFAILLVTLPLNGLMQLRFDSYGYDNGFSYMENFAYSYVPRVGWGGGWCVMPLLFGALCAMAVFSHLYNPRSANFFGGLPVRREGLFLTHYLAGLAFFIVPNVVIVLLTLLVELAGGVVCWQGLGFWLAVMCGEGFFFYSLAVFCAMFTGLLVGLPAFYTIVNVLVYGVRGMVELVLRGFYYGYSGMTERGYAVVKWLTPAAKLEESVRSHVNYIGEVVDGSIPAHGGRELVTEGLDVVGVYAVAAAVLAACAFLLYRVRRLESAGDVVAVTWMRPVFKYGVAFCAGLALGLVTKVFTGGGELGLMAAILFWGVAGYFAAQMLLDKSFKVFSKWKGAVAVAAVFAALFCVVGFDLTGFETRVPSPDSVDSVYAHGIDTLYLGDAGDSLSINVTDPEAIGLFTILHKEAVGQRDWDWRNHEGRELVSANLELDYRLKNGGTLSRQYTLWLDPDEIDEEGTAAWAVQRLYNDRELYWREYGFDRLEELLAGGVRLERVDVSRFDGEYGTTREGALYAADARRVLEAVKEDFFAGRIGVRRVDDEAHWHHGPAENSLTFVSGETPEGWVCTVEIALQDTASSTLAALSALSEALAESWSPEYPDTRMG